MVIAARSLRIGVGVLIAIPLAACTGGGSEGPSAAVSSQYTLGGSVSGLTGSGLILQNNSGESLPIAANGPFTFKTTLTSGSSYYVITADQPASPNQTCAVGNPTGIISSTNINNINVVCTDKANPAADTVGVTTTGITGAGLVLQNNGADNLAVSADGSFKFALTVPSGSQYEVSVLSPPINPYQDCVVSNGSGTADGSDVANVVVSCSVNTNPTHTISGTITGVSGAVVLQDNGRDDITVTADGAFQFPLKIPQGSVYVVSTKSAAGGQSQTCQFQNARGIVGDHDVTDIMLTCDANIAIKVAVSGLSGTGLVLQNNQSDNLAVSTNGTTSFPTPAVHGAPYSVTVAAQPTNPSQTCTVTNGTGNATGPVTASVSCITDQFAVGGTVLGLPDPDSTATINLVVQNNLGDDVTIPVDSQSPATFTFPTPIASGSNYSVTVKTQPGVDTSDGTPGVTQTSTVCLVSGGAGTVGNGPVNNVVVNCVRPGGFAYVTNGVDSTVTEYLIDSATGLLLPLGATANTGSGPSCATAYSSTLFYVCNKTSNDLSAYAIDPNTGVLTQAAGSPVALVATAPAFAALQAYGNGVALYLTSSPAGATPGSVSAFAVGSTPTTLTPINQLATGVTPAAGLIYAANQSTESNYFAALSSTDNTLSLYRLDDTTGALTAFQSGMATGAGPRDIVYHVGFDPADGGLFFDDVYVANSGDGTITQYGSDNNSAVLSQGGTVSAGAGLHSLVVSPTDYLYATATQGVFGFSFGTAGALVPMAGNPFPAGAAPGAIGALDNYVYVVNQTDETVSVFFSGAAAGGALTPIVANTPIKTGHGPVNIVVIQRPAFGPG